MNENVLTPSERRRGLSERSTPNNHALMLSSTKKKRAPMRALGMTPQQHQQQRHRASSHQSRSKPGAKQKSQYSLTKVSSIEALFEKGDDSDRQQHRAMVDAMLQDNSNIESWYQLIIFEQLLLSRHQPDLVIRQCPEFLYNIECSLEFGKVDNNYYPQLQLKRVSLIDDIPTKVTTLKQLIDPRTPALEEHLIEGYLKLAELQQSAGDWSDALATIDEGLTRVESAEGYALQLKRTELLLSRPKSVSSAAAPEESTTSVAREEARTAERPTSIRRKSKSRRSQPRRRMKLLGKAARHAGSAQDGEDEEDEEEDQRASTGSVETPMPAGAPSAQRAPVVRVTFAPSVPGSPKEAPKAPQGPAGAPLGATHHSPARAKVATPKVLYSSPAKRVSRLAAVTPGSSAKPQTPSRVLFRSAVKPSAPPVNAMPKAGERLSFSGDAFKLQVLSLLGQGGYATVWKVLDAKGRVLALKCMKDRDEFDHELRILSMFKDDELFLKEFCIRMFHAERAPSRHTELTPAVSFLLFEQGSLDLRRIMNRRRGLPPTDVQFYWSRCVRCIAALHRFGVIHCDVKPSNFVMVEGRIKLIDFGIACLESANQAHSKGTLSYMPQDIVKPLAAKKPAAPPTRARDVWSLGCLLYEMAYGRTPYKSLSGPKEDTSLMALIADSETPKRFIFNEIAGLPTLQSTVNACMQLNPAARPTASQLLKLKIIETTGAEYLM